MQRTHHDSLAALATFLLVLLGLGGGACSSKPGDRFNAGVNLILQHRHADAEIVFLELTKQHPTELSPWLNLAISQLNQSTDAKIEAALATIATIEEFAPGDPHARFLHGIVHQYRDDHENALQQFLKVLEILPADPDAHYWAAAALTILEREAEALPHLEAAVAANPLLRSAWYRLSQLYGQLGRRDDAAKALAEFQLLKAAKRGAERDIKYTMMGRLADAITEWTPTGQAAEDGAKPIRFGAPAIVEGAAPPFAFVDPDMSGAVFLWTGGKEAGVYALSAKGGKCIQPVEALGASYSFAVADLDDDARIDLVTSGAAGVEIWLNASRDGKLIFAKAAGLQAAARGIVRLADLDLERDLDLVFAPETGQPAIAINRGLEAGFAPLAEGAKFLQGVSPGARLLAIRDFDGDLDLELLFSAEEGLTLVDNGPEWRFRVAPGERKLAVTGVVHDLVAADLDADGFDDLVVAGSGCGIWWNDGKGNFPGPPESGDSFSGAKALYIADLDLDGYSDILAAGSEATRVIRNRGRRVVAEQSLKLPAAAGMAAADIDGDFDLDLAICDAAGRVWVIANETAPPHNVLLLTLRGEKDGAEGDRRTNSHGIGVRVEVRCGDLRHDLTYDGTPGARAQGLAPIPIGLGQRKKGDLLIVRWTDGVEQSEFELEKNRHRPVVETQRKPNSCPVLFTWDGAKFRHITDFLGGGGIGIWAAPGRFEPFDPTETVRIPPGALAPFRGEYVLSVMEPMEEISYLDRLRLRAIDHPAGVEIHPDELFSTSSALAPSGEAIAIGAGAKIFPARARDDRGRDVLEALLEIDRVYPEGFALDRRHVGYAEPHSLIIGFDGALPRDRDVSLFLHGWVEYAYSRTNFSAYQAGKKLEPPSFSFRAGANEEWTMLYEHAGFPAGLSKTMVLDITRAARAGATEIRIDTNMEVYWDQIFAASPASVAGIVAREVPRKGALLRFGGFPRWYSDDDRRPKTLHYHERMPDNGFKRFAGARTPHGEVGELLDAADDRFVLIGSGEEILFRYDAAALPELPESWTRTFFLEAFGYVKDMDPLSATPFHIEPLPSAAMTEYPPR